MNNTLNKEVSYIQLPLVDYQEAWDYQEKLFAGILEIKAANRNLPPEEVKATPNYLIFCQHPHVYTLGKSGSENNLLINEEFLKHKGATFYKINRGGDITYHGPGQLVGYPIFDLDNFFTDIHKYLRLLEEAVIMTLAEYGLVAGRIPGLTGVWLDHEKQERPRKICAMGVKCSRWVTMHGFAFNINTDLDYFNYIVPCGITDKAVTSLQKELGYEVPMAEVEQKMLHHIEQLFEANITIRPMKAHIDFKPVEGVAVAIAKETDELSQEVWNVFLINNNDFYLDNVLVSSKGYGMHNGEQVRTSVLRHMFEQVPPKTAVKVEPIDPAIFHITNEYWVSYYIGKKIYDKKYVFVPESIIPENLVEIAILNAKGILHY